MSKVIHIKLYINLLRHLAKNVLEFYTFCIKARPTSLSIDCQREFERLFLINLARCNCL